MGRRATDVAVQFQIVVPGNVAELSGGTMAGHGEHGFDDLVEARPISPGLHPVKAAMHLIESVTGAMHHHVDPEASICWDGTTGQRW